MFKRISLSSIEMNIHQVVIWGHKLHTHTHSYIHNAFFKTFTYLGYKTHWFDMKDSINNVKFENTLFLTEGQVDHNIPLRNDGYYILHNCKMDKYKSLPKKNILILQVYTHDVLKRDCIKIDDCIYYSPMTENSYAILYIPWATDLHPEEINQNIETLGKTPAKDQIVMVGTKVPEWKQIEDFCNANRILYKVVGGKESVKVDIDTNKQQTHESLLAPSIQMKWQVENGYIPCRIFKNISYGKMGITNNETVYHLFKQKILYHPDIKECLAMGLAFEKKDAEYKKNILIPLMEFVRDKHTYLHRIQTIMDCFLKGST
jgi:hypothetical protein